MKKGISILASYLRDHDTGKVVLFCNSKVKSFQYVADLERKLDEAKESADILHIQGDLHKQEKFWRIRLFCGNVAEEIDELNFRGLVSTNASNVGIDDNTIKLVVRFGWSRDLCTCFQEMGRGSREAGSLSTFLLLADLPSFDFLMGQALGAVATEDESSDIQLEFAAATQSNTPLTKNAQQALDQRKSKEKKT